jgi:hypothetical protein
MAAVTPLSGDLHALLMSYKVRPEASMKGGDGDAIFPVDLFALCSAIVLFLFPGRDFV